MTIETAPPTPDPMRIWSNLGRTDPAMTKRFKRPGGFEGTSVKPIYSLERMTEFFGPCGIGWGMSEPAYAVVHITPTEEILVFCNVGIWYVDPATGARSELVYGNGGDRIFLKDKNGYRSSDDAQKAALTDAVANAMKYIGMSADIHGGLHDDDKYVRELAREFRDEQRPPPPPPSPPPAPPPQTPPPQIPPTPGTDQVRNRLRDKEDAERIRAELMTAQSEVQIDNILNDPVVDRFQRERSDIFNKLIEIADRCRANVPPF
jgi:hypothetical protein